MVKRSILKLYRTTIFLAQLWMAAFDHLFNKCNQKLGRWNQIPEVKSKQQVLRNCCHILSNGCSMLHFVSYKSRTHYSIALKFSITLIKTTSAFFLIICRSSEITHSLTMWLKNYSFRERYLLSSQKLLKKEKNEVYIDI